MQKQELKELATSIYERINRSIEESNKESTLDLVEQIKREQHMFHRDVQMWIHVLLTYIADKLGEDAVHEALRIVDERCLGTFTTSVAGPASADDRLRRRAYIWTSRHAINIDEIIEDDEKFTLNLKCPSGGALRVREQDGKTRKGHFWSSGEKGVPYYCTHCIISFQEMSIERLGYPAWISMPKPDGRCTQYVFKDPRAVPEEYYQRVGKKKKTGEA